MEFKLKIYFVLLVIMAATLISCSYSFTGASVPQHLKTIYIPTFIDNSGKGEKDLDTRFTSETIQKFIEDNNLRVVDNKRQADATIDCTIARFTEVAASISGDEVVDNMKITIGVKVIYRDLVEKTTIFEQTFSNEAYYDNSASDFVTARNDAIESVIELVSEDIVLGVVANW